MAINFSPAVYQICQDTFGRPVAFTGIGYSGPGRGIYESDKLETISEEGGVMVEQQTILDIREDEYPTLPVQGDTVTIPAEPISGLPDEGTFQIIKVTNNSGGEVTLQLREIFSAP